jgi:cytochrome c-type biogenesis protein CcmH/NrfG
MRHRSLLCVLGFAMALAAAPPDPARALAPGTAQSQDALELARRQFDAGDYSGAERTLRAALPTRQRDAELHFWIGRCRFELMDVDGAIASFERAVELAPQNSEYHLWLGRAYGRKAGRDRSFSYARRSKSSFEQAVRLDPANLRARRDLFDYLMQAPWIAGGSKSGAREQCEAITGHDAMEGRLCWASYWERENQPARADAEFRAILEARPATASPYLSVARHFSARGDTATALAALEAAERVAPDEPNLNYYRPLVWVAAGRNLDAAEQQLQTYLMRVPQRTGRPSHAAARKLLGELYEKQGRAREALEQYRLALRMDPRNRDLRDAVERLEKRA